VRAQLRSELLKQRTTRTGLGVFAAMLGLVTLAILLHGLGLPADRLRSETDQITVLFGRGELLGVLFAALLGALSMTAEIRHGTIRPTFLITPRRGRVVAAKVAVSMAIGAGFGLAACALALAVGATALGARGIDIRSDGGDYALLVAGGAAAAALWAAIGVGLGAIVRNQVPTVIAICAWLLFVEGLLVGDVTGLGDVARFAPGAAAAAITGQDPAALLAPGIGLVVLGAYAVAAALAGARATTHRDVA
jgi:ABC-2 type transport system permease protein